MEDIINILESKLNGNSQSLSFKIYNELHFFDEPTIDEYGNSQIQCILGNPAGSYLPLFNTAIEDQNRVLTIFFPLDQKDEVETALKEFRLAIVGARFDKGEDKSFAFNMDVPVFSEIRQEVLKQFSNEDGRFKFESKPYGSIQFRIYFKAIPSSYLFGNHFRVFLKHAVLNNKYYEITPLSFRVVSTREISSYQYLEEGTITSLPNANAVSYEFQTFISTTEQPTMILARQGLTGGSSPATDRFYGYLKIVMGDSDSSVVEIPVIASSVELTANRGDMSLLRFTLVRTKEDW